MSENTRPQSSAEPVADNLHDSLMIELAYCRHAEKTVSETVIRIEAVIASALEAARREALEQAADVLERAVCPNGELDQLDAIRQFQTAAAAHLRALALKENPNAV